VTAIGRKETLVSPMSRAVLSGLAVSAVVFFGVVAHVWAQALATNRQANQFPKSMTSTDVVVDSSILTNMLEVTPPSDALQDFLLKPSNAGETHEDRLVKFDQQYGITQDSSSALGRMLQAAKYKLDQMCFAAQEAAKKLEFSHEFGVGSESVHGGGITLPEYSLPLFGRFGHPQLRSNVTVHDTESGQTFIGLKLSIPFGPRGPGEREESAVPLIRGRPGETSG